MENYLWLLLVAAVLVIAFVMERGRRRRAAEETRQATLVAAQPRDYVADRESSRLAQMSEEDRAWEQESLRKQREQS